MFEILFVIAMNLNGMIVPVDAECNGCKKCFIECNEYVDVDDGITKTACHCVSKT